jgi:hypothetical protein
LNLIPAKIAMAVKGTKLGGWGINLISAAKTINKVINSILLFFSFI